MVYYFPKAYIHHVSNGVDGNSATNGGGKFTADIHGQHIPLALEKFFQFILVCARARLKVHVLFMQYYVNEPLHAQQDTAGPFGTGSPLESRTRAMDVNGDLLLVCVFDHL